MYEINMKTIKRDLEEDESELPTCSCCDNTRYVLEKYNELIYAVESKYHGETRHQTALRCIMESENTEASVQQQSAANEGKYDGGGNEL